MNNVEECKKRWRRWLGQVTRFDRANWTKLLQSNYIGWARRILKRHGIDRPNPSNTLSPHIQTRFYFKQAINLATPSELKKLDEIYCDELIED